MSNDSGAGVFLVVVLFIVGIVIWLVVAWVAAMLAPSDRFWTFFCLTLLLFGPLGIVLAVVASPRDPAYWAPLLRSIAAGHVCPRCGAEEDLPPERSEKRSKNAADTLRDALLAKWEAHEGAEASADRAEARAKAARARADELRRQVRESKDR